MAGRIDAYRVATDAGLRGQAERVRLDRAPERPRVPDDGRRAVRAGRARAREVRRASSATPRPCPAQRRPSRRRRPQPQQFKIIGKKIPRVHGLGVVTGLGQYTEHLSMQGMLHTRTLRSPHPHAKVSGVNTQKAEQLPGVARSSTAATCPPEYRDVKLGAGRPTASSSTRRCSRSARRSRSSRPRASTSPTRRSA